MVLEEPCLGLSKLLPSLDDEKSIKNLLASQIGAHTFHVLSSLRKQTAEPQGMVTYQRWPLFFTQILWESPRRALDRMLRVIQGVWGFSFPLSSWSSFRPASNQRVESTMSRQGLETQRITVQVAFRRGPAPWGGERASQEPRGWRWRQKVKNEAEKERYLRHGLKLFNKVIRVPGKFRTLYFFSLK